MKKKYIQFLSFSLLLLLIWYFFIKKDDYIIRFNAKTSPGTLFVSAEEWNLLNQNKGEFSFAITERIPFYHLHQTLSKNGMDLSLNWSLRSINDSITKVKVGISEDGNGALNRLTAPFFNTNFKKTSLELIENYKQGIDFMIKEKFRVHSIEIDSTPDLLFAFIQVENIKMRDKASQMMKNNSTILAYLRENNIEKQGYPLLVVDKWYPEKNTISFKFGFQVKPKDSLPVDDLIKFETLTSKKAIKAIYNGNYIGSDKAWFAIHEYAQRNNIDLLYEPTEVFYSNPFLGENELEWVAEIYIPIQSLEKQ